MSSDQTMQTSRNLVRSISISPDNGDAESLGKRKVPSASGLRTKALFDGLASGKIGLIVVEPDLLRPETPFNAGSPRSPSHSPCPMGAVKVQLIDQALSKIPPLFALLKDLTITPAIKCSETKADLVDEMHHCMEDVKRSLEDARHLVGGAIDAAIPEIYKIVGEIEENGKCEKVRSLLNELRAALENMEQFLVVAQSGEGGKDLETELPDCPVEDPEPPCDVSRSCTEFEQPCKVGRTGSVAPPL